MRLTTYGTRWRNQLVNIAKQQIVPGAWIALADRDNPRQDCWCAVTKVEKTPSATVVKVTTLVIKSENPNYKPNETRIFTFDSLGDSIMGFYFKDGQDTPGIADVSYNESSEYLSYLVAYLKTLDMRSNKCSTTEIVKKFKQQGLLPDKMPNDTARRIVLKVVELNQDVLEHHGGGIVRLLTNREIELRKEERLVSTAANIKDVKYVDQDKLIQGVVSIVESGILGNVVWTGVRKWAEAMGRKR